MIEIEGIKCGLYGNLFLLDNPVKSFVKISRDKSEMNNMEEKFKEWEETMRCDGVLVSPFINPAEKEIRDKAIKNGNGVIVILDYRMSERAKPYKFLFDLCAKGKLLIVSTEEYDYPQAVMKYTHARHLNSIGRAVAQLSPMQAKLIPRKSP